MSNPFKAWLIAPKGVVGREKDIEQIDRVLGKYERVHHDGHVTSKAIRDFFQDDLGIAAHKGPRLVWVIGHAVQNKDDIWCLETYGLEHLPLEDLWRLVTDAANDWLYDRMTVVFDVCHGAQLSLPGSVVAFMACAADEKTLADAETGGWLTRTLVSCLERGICTPEELDGELRRERPGTQRPQVHFGAHPSEPINGRWPASSWQTDSVAKQRRQIAFNELTRMIRSELASADKVRVHFETYFESGDMVEQMCALPGVRLAPWLARASRDLPEQLSTVRKLACLVMPLLTDWRRLQDDLAQQVASGNHLLQLPVSDLSVCEVILAGLNGRTAAFLETIEVCVGILADARQAKVQRPAFFSAAVLPERESQHLPTLVAQRIVKASGQIPGKGEGLFEQARGVLLITQALYQSYLMVPETLSPKTSDAVLAKLPGLWLVQSIERSDLTLLSSALRTVLNILFPNNSRVAS